MSKLKTTRELARRLCTSVQYHHCMYKSDSEHAAVPKDNSFAGQQSMSSVQNKLYLVKSVLH